MRPTFRFAPSPNGRLHLGHAYSALLNHELARRAGGRLLVRIEDIDVARSREAYVDAIREDLAWLGIAFEEMPRQSTRFGSYREALSRLAGRDLLYASAASRGAVLAAVRGDEAETGRLWPRDPDGSFLHPRERLGEGGVRGGDPVPGAALRLDMEAALLGVPALAWTERGEGAGEASPGGAGIGGERMISAAPREWGDVVLARKDVPASYHLAVVVDDAEQGVTDVVRGQDLLRATSVHRLLQHLLGLPAPRYHHHHLIRGGHGEKLSKSLASRSLAALREDGAGPADVRRMVGL